MDKDTKTVVAVVIMIAVAAALYFFRDKITALLKPKTTTTTHPPPPATGCTYPVTTASASACILQAFKDSGYFNALQASISGGVYPSSYLQSMTSSPSSWLAGHSYLYSAYPQYFAPAF